MRYIVAQTVLDLLGDLLSKSHQIQRTERQCSWHRFKFCISQSSSFGTSRSSGLKRLPLPFSLCLTLFMVLVTIIRISGNLKGGVVDLGWELFFIIIAGEIGIILSAMTAFRAFFVARHKGDNRGAKKSPESRRQLHSRSGYFLKILVTPSLWRFKRRAQSASGGYAANDFGLHLPSGNLPDIPRAHMTGSSNVYWSLLWRWWGGGKIT